jgi:hypothetical protein
MKITMLFIFCFIFTISFFGQEWKRLKILQSTRKDVLKTLGHPSSMSRNGRAYHYDNDKEKIYLSFASGKCTKSDFQEWKVAKNTLVRIIIQPQKKMLLSETKFDLKTFEKSEPDRQYRIIYISKDSSIQIETYSDGINAEEITNITYLPSRDKFDLRCKK